jgi:DNA-binding winged helix-turn-helix (wHTH) protein
VRVRFDDWLFDTDARELARAGHPRALSPKAFQLLSLLLERRPRAASHEELRDTLWPDSNVARTSLARLVTEIRKVLGDGTREPRYVRTLHGFGYAFCGEASAADASPGLARATACSLQWGERSVSLVEGENLIGRTTECRIAIDSPQVSRRHARVFVSGGRATVEDLGSKNGTFVGDKRVERPTRLEDGDAVIVGSALLLFRAGAGDDSTKTGAS